MLYGKSIYWSLNKGHLNLSYEQNHLTNEKLYNARGNTPGKPESKR